MCWASAAPRQPPLAKTSVVEVHTTPTYISEHTNASKAMKSTYGATVISDAQAFVAAAKARQDDGATKTSSLQALKILQDHDASALRSVLDKYDIFVFDCDGVLWRGAELLPGSARTLALLRTRGKRVFFVTNNSSKSRAEYVAKFTKLKISVDVSEIIPSSWAAAEYLRVERPDVKKAFVIGCQGLVDELALVGIDSICGADKEYATRIYATEADFLAIDADPDVGAVVCGWDLTFNYAKLCLASLHLQKNPGAAFVATNKDAFDKLADRNVPGNGCAVAAVEQSVNRMAVTVGKPSKWLVDRLMTMHGLDPRRTVVVGDRLDTDIQLGVVGGCDTVLVGTGCTSTVEALVVEEEEGGQGKGRGLPTYLLSHLGALSGDDMECRNGNEKSDNGV